MVVLVLMLVAVDSTHSWHHQCRRARRDMIYIYILREGGGRTNKDYRDACTTNILASEEITRDFVCLLYFQATFADRDVCLIS